MYPKEVFLGPLILPWCVVGRSVCLSARPSTPVTRQPMFWIFSKIGGDIPLVNISRPFFHLKKKLYLKFFLI